MHQCIYTDYMLIFIKQADRWSLKFSISMIIEDNLATNIAMMVGMEWAQKWPRRRTWVEKLERKSSQKKEGKRHIPVDKYRLLGKEN